MHHGVVQGSCNGFLTVCCAQPTNSQHVSFEGDDKFKVKVTDEGYNLSSLSTSASSFR